MQSDFSPSINSVSAQMRPASGGNYLDSLLGKSKNGMPGLMGLMGGPQQGGPLQALMGQAPQQGAGGGFGDFLSSLFGGGGQPGLSRSVSAPMRPSSANTYATAARRNNSGSGTTSWGASRTQSDGSSWAA